MMGPVVLVALVTFGVAAAPEVAVMPFVDAGAGPRATKQAFEAFKASSADTNLAPLKWPKEMEEELGVELGPAVAACKKDVICLTQIGSMMNVPLMLVVQVRGKKKLTAHLQILSVASAVQVREVTLELDGDGRAIHRGFRAGVYWIFGVTGAGELVLAGVPDGASVFVDGQRREAKSFAVEFGYHSVKVAAAGFETFQKEVFVKPKERVNVAVKLDQMPLSEPPLVAPPALRPAAPAEPLPLVAPMSPVTKEEKSVERPAAKVSLPVERPEHLRRPPPRRMVAQAPASPVVPSPKQPVAAPSRGEVIRQAEPEALSAGRSPFRIPCIVGAVLTAGALAGGGVTAGLFSSSSGAAQRETVQIAAADRLREAERRGNMANVLWVTAGALGAATIALLALDLSYRAPSARISLGVGPGRVVVQGGF